MIYITRKEHFNAAHRLFNNLWNNEENLAFYGKCSNPNWHGHNYTLFVTVKGQINTKTGFLINLKDLSQIIKTLIIEKIDHKNINIEVDFMKNKFASTEVLCVEIWKQIDNPIKELGATLHCVKLLETENNFVEYYGENE